MNERREPGDDVRGEFGEGDDIIGRGRPRDGGGVGASRTDGLADGEREMHDGRMRETESA